MEESVRSAMERVPACVGLSLPGGGRAVCLGFQRIVLAVVSWFAMASCADGGVVERDCSREGFDCAVLAMSDRSEGWYPGGGTLQINRRAMEVKDLRITGLLRELRLNGGLEERRAAVDESSLVGRGGNNARWRLTSRFAHASLAYGQPLWGSLFMEMLYAFHLSLSSPVEPLV